MAVTNRPCGVFHCARNDDCHQGASHNGWTLKSSCYFIKTQLCTLSLSLTLFNSVRLPREAFKHGTVPYLVIYTFWLLAASLPTMLLQLAMGQLSQQDPIGVWRAVPILRGIGHLKLITSYICCVYVMVHLALCLAYVIWIGKDTFPLKVCTKLHITPNGYDTKMNATVCFNSTFLAPFTEYPQYLGIIVILLFVLWFFLPIFLYRLRKSLKVVILLLAPVTGILAVTLYALLADNALLSSLLVSCEDWMPLSQPYIWHSALVQALLSTQLVGGYLVSAGGTVYRHSDVRWISATIIFTNLIAGWLWVFMWESIGGNSKKDTSFIAILILIYQSSLMEKRTKKWPLLCFGIVSLSGIITVLTLLYPIYDKFHRQAGDHWRVIATASSAIGTALSVAVFSRGLEIATLLDELVVPVLAVFTAAVEVVGFVFIYGWCYLSLDIEFLTGCRVPCMWIATWWITPLLLFGISGWWLKTLIRATWGQVQTLWPLVGVFIGILVVMVVLAAIVVAKEEQFNLFSKFSSAFRPSRLWGPEEPMTRYLWMSQRHQNEIVNNEHNLEAESKCPQLKPINIKKNFSDKWRNVDSYRSSHDIYTEPETYDGDYHKTLGTVSTTYTVPRSVIDKRVIDKSHRSSNVCVANGELGFPVQCNCKRHFTLNVPNLKKEEIDNL